MDTSVRLICIFLEWEKGEKSITAMVASAPGRFGVFLKVWAVSKGGMG